MSNYNNYDDIQDRHMDTMIRLAYLQKEALETEDILKEVEKSDKENEQVHPDIAYQMFKRTTPIISKKPVKPGKSRDRGTEFTTKLLLLD